MTYLVTSKPECDVVPLTEMKDYLRISTTVDDNLIESLIQAGVGIAEKFMRRDIITTTYENYRESFFEDLTLRRAGFKSVTSVEYLKDGTYQTMATSNYTVSIGGSYGQICEIESVPSIDHDCNAVRITFTTGFGDDPDQIPEQIKTAIKIYVAFMYENRGDCNCGTESGFPAQGEALLGNFRVIPTC